MSQNPVYKVCSRSRVALISTGAVGGLSVKPNFLPLARARAYSGEGAIADDAGSD